MANIIPLKESSGAQFYPQTHLKAVVDSEGNTLDEILENLEPGGATNAVKYTAQTLTDVQKAQARTNIGANEVLVSGTNIKTINNQSILGEGNIVIQGGGGSDPDAVKYTEQTLTDAQKAQARTNIGAGTSSFSGNYNDLSNKPTIPTVPAISTDIYADKTSNTKTASPKAVYDAIQDILDMGLNVINVAEDGFFIVDADYSIGMMLTADGITARNVSPYEFEI